MQSLKCLLLAKILVETGQLKPSSSADEQKHASQAVGLAASQGLQDASSLKPLLRQARHATGLACMRGYRDYGLGYSA